MGELQDKGKVSFMYYVHASDCGSAHCNGAWLMAFLLGEHVEYYH